MSPALTLLRQQSRPDAWPLQQPLVFNPAAGTVGRPGRMAQGWGRFVLSTRVVWRP